jgi:hypothetical protein
LAISEPDLIARKPVGAIRKLLGVASIAATEAMISYDLCRTVEIDGADLIIMEGAYYTANEWRLSARLLE